MKFYKISNLPHFGVFLKYKNNFCFKRKDNIYRKKYKKLSPLKPEILINKKGKQNKINKKILSVRLLKNKLIKIKTIPHQIKLIKIVL